MAIVWLKPVPDLKTRPRPYTDVRLLMTMMHRRGNRHMKQLSLIGTQLIHTYPLISRFNGCRLDKATEYKPGWVKTAKLADHQDPMIPDCRVTKVWSPDREEARRLSEALCIDSVCDTLENATRNVDGVLVQDEVIQSRTRLVEHCLREGLPVFADKTLSNHPATTAQLIDLAEEQGTPIRSWSQLYFLPGLQSVRQAQAGGIAFLTYRITLDILPMYAVHIMSMLQGAFRSRAKTYRTLDADERREALITLCDGTRIFTHASPNVPPHGRLYYCGVEQAVLADNMDHAACFDAAADALGRLFRGEKEVPGPDLEAMRELTQLVALFVEDSPTGNTHTF